MIVRNVTEKAARHDTRWAAWIVVYPVWRPPEFLIPASGAQAMVRSNRSRYTSGSHRRSEAQIYGDSLEHGWAHLERTSPARLE